MSREKVGVIVGLSKLMKTDPAYAEALTKTLQSESDFNLSEVLAMFDAGASTDETTEERWPAVSSLSWKSSAQPKKQDSSPISKH